MVNDAREYEPIINPQQGVNDVDAVLMEWYVKDGDPVEPGQVLCDMQTAKASYDLTAHVSGVIKTIAKSGERAKVNQEVAVVFASAEGYAAHADAVHARLREKYSETKVQITEKARRLAESLGVDVGGIKTGTGIIKERDVRQHHERSSTAEAEGRGRVNEAFLRTLREDRDFPGLASEEKVRLYRENGAVVGANVTFGPGSVVIARFIEIGDGTSFGEYAAVTADRFRIGELGAIGPHASILTRSVWIGDVFFSGNGIIIGGGGAFGKNSEFRCGDNCLVSSQCIINTTEPVVFGDEVGLSPRVQIYTHSHWQDVFDGYAASFGPVTIGDQSYLTGSAMIVPGVTVGKGCTVLANSVVTSNVEDRCVVFGVPAAVVGRVEADLPMEKKDRIMQRLLPELKGRLAEQQLDPDGFVYVMDYDGSTAGPVVLTFHVIGTRTPSGTTVFDFGRKEIIGAQNRYTDEIRNFFRKRGVRFKPYQWRYTHDVGLFNQ